MVVEITVRGEAAGQYPPERAIVTLAAAVETPEKQQAYDQAASVQQAITAQLTELADRDAVIDWSSGTVSVSSYRPWRDDGGPAAGPPRRKHLHVPRPEHPPAF